MKKKTVLMMLLALTLLGGCGKTEEPQIEPITSEIEVTEDELISDTVSENEVLEAEILDMAEDMQDALDIADSYDITYGISNPGLQILTVIDENGQYMDLQMDDADLLQRMLTLRDEYKIIPVTEDADPTVKDALYAYLDNEHLFIHGELDESAQDDAITADDTKDTEIEDEALDDQMEDAETTEDESAETKAGEEISPEDEAQALADVEDEMYEADDTFTENTALPKIVPLKKLVSFSVVKEGQIIISDVTSVDQLADL